MTLGRSRQALLLSVALAAIHISWAAGVLPDEVAGHFDGSGHADGLSTRGAFLAGYVFAVLTITCSFGGLAWLLPRLPASALNLPNRDYWLAGERAQLASGIIARWLLWTGAGTNLFLVAVFHLTVLANLGEGEPRLGPAFGLLLGAYLVGMTVAVIALVVGFSKPGREKP